jgi:peptidase M28-like protein
MRRIFLVAAATFVPAMLAAQATGPAEPAITIVPQPATTLPLKHTPEPTTSDITAKDLMTRLYIYADDSMQGREAGTLGNYKATTYIAGEVKKMGLVPAGDSGTYFQTVPIKSRTLDPASSFTADGAPLTLGTDWSASGNGEMSVASAAAVYGGLLGDSTVTLTPEQVAGKVVVYSFPAGRRVRFVRPAAGAAAVAIISDQLIGVGRRPAMFVDDPSRPAPTRPATATIFLSSAGAARLFNAPLDQLKAGDAGKPAAISIHMTVKPVEFPGRNVVAILPGSDPKLKNEYVAVGAHNDHIGMTAEPVDHDSMRIFLHIVRPGGAEDGRKQATPEQQAEVNAQLAQWRAAHPNSMRADTISNGADDDGSGTVSVLEIAQKMSSLKTKPRRSIIFVWHVGEEKGLWGSAYFTDHPTVPRDSIVAQLNMDMVGRGDAWDVTGQAKEGGALRGNPNYLQLVGSRRLSKELGDIVEQVNTQDKHGFVFDYGMDANGHPMNIYCRSDHYEYARYGIPITFFTTGGHSDYHQVTDEPEYIDYDHMARIGNLVEDIAVHVANLDHRIVVDQPKPDPQGRCVQ